MRGSPLALMCALILLASACAPSEQVLPTLAQLPTLTPSPSPTITLPATNTPPPTSTATATPTPTTTFTPSPTIAPTLTASASPTFSATPTVTPSLTVQPSATQVFIYFALQSSVRGRAEPDAASTALLTLQRGDPVRVFGAVQGSEIDGNTTWLRGFVGNTQIFVHSSLLSLTAPVGDPNPSAPPPLPAQTEDVGP